MKIAIVVGIIYYACSTYWQTEIKKPVDVPLVRLTNPVRQTVPILIRTPSVFEPWVEVLIRPRVDGVIKKVHFQEGSLVQKDDVLFELDDDILLTQLHQAEASLAKDQALLNEAEKDLVRNTELTSRDMASKSALDHAKAQAESLRESLNYDKAQIDALKIQIAYSVIKSPVKGMAGYVHANVGTFVRQTETTPLLRVQQIDPLQAHLQVPERFSGILLSKKVEDISVKLFDLTHKPIQANIQAVAFDTQIDPAKGTLDMKIKVDSLQKGIRPGMTLVAEIQLGEHSNVLTLPEQAVLMGQAGNFVYAYDPITQKVAVKPVTVIDTYQTLVIVEGDITEQDSIVTEGQVKLRDGCEVLIESGNNSNKKIIEAKLSKKA